VDRSSQPGPESTTLEAVGDQWRYAPLVVVQAGDDDDDELHCEMHTNAGRAYGPKMILTLCNPLIF